MGGTTMITHGTGSRSRMEARSSLALHKYHPPFCEPHFIRFNFFPLSRRCTRPEFPAFVSCLQLENRSSTPNPLLVWMKIDKQSNLWKR
ncbi:hypothetical protein HNY73_002108 [Argiope bruennichi]|uniref:Uncharacterized protein n=1 Tax=Argiope bruennichi TaxID=94029 RepID=A0A8T0FWR7_ARGBR|nr:hypothetical protein HNY73_002108 [Argiope bruennichi]